MVSPQIKTIIAVTGLVSMLGFTGANKYRQHKNDEITRTRCSWLSQSQQAVGYYATRFKTRVREILKWEP